MNRVSYRLTLGIGAGFEKRTQRKILYSHSGVNGDYSILEYDDMPVGK
jgi:hypothetical protein